MKRKTNISVQDNTGVRVTSSLIVGQKSNGYKSGDILDANAVQEKISDLVNLAPEALDSLGEIAEVLNAKANTADLANVATSGSYADLSNKPTIPDVSGKENTSNKVTSISSNSTDTQYPSAKAVYDAIHSSSSVSTIYIDESLDENEEFKKVSITGDIAVYKNDDGEIIYDNNIPRTKPSSSNVISWIRENSKIYHGYYVDDVHRLYVVNKNNDTNYTDQDRYVFMKLPQFWFKCVPTEVGVAVSFTHDYSIADSTWNEWDGNTFIGCYETNIQGVDDQTENPSDLSPNDCYLDANLSDFASTGFSWLAGRTMARNCGQGFSMITYEAHQIMEILFYAYYGDVDSQAVCGIGNSVSSWSSSRYSNGRQLVETSMIDTCAGDNSANIIFWGLENWWGNVYEWVDNLQILGYDQENHTITIGILEIDGTIKRTVVINAPNDYLDGCKTKNVWGKYADVIPAADDEGGYDFSIGYSDYGYVYGDLGYVADRSCYSDDADGGVGYLDVEYAPDGRNYDVGSRLLYSGQWCEVDNDVFNQIVTEDITIEY